MAASANRIVCISVVLGIALAFSFAAPCADASDFRLGAVRIVQPWARATIGQGRVGVAYMRLENVGEKSDRLIGATTPVAEHGSLHTHRMTGDIMRMRPVDAIPIPAGGNALLEPGGLHIMLMRLTQPLKQGERFPLTLAFERSGTVTVEVTVKSATAKSANDTHQNGG